MAKLEFLIKNNISTNMIAQFLNDKILTPIAELSKPQLYFIIIFSIMIVYFIFQRWTPILDHMNLAIHEGGHVFFNLLGRNAVVYGGSVLQVVFPLVFCIYFYKRDDYLGYLITSIWTLQSLCNVGYYVADARAKQLPLIGGLDPELYHDWSEILTRWNLMAYDTIIGYGLIYSSVAAIGFLNLMIILNLTLLRNDER